MRKSPRLSPAAEPPFIPGEDIAIENADGGVPGEIITGVRMLIVPGLGDSGPQHWQTLWEQGQRAHGAVRVVQNDWESPKKDDWVAKLDEDIRKFSDKEIALVGHSLGCLTIVHWARECFEKALEKTKIRGALLVAPTDPERYPPCIVGYAETPMTPLPFPSTVVSSTTDPWITIERSQQFAQAWRARFVNVGGRGHINSDSNLGAWPEGQQLLRELIAARQR